MKFFIGVLLVLQTLGIVSGCSNSNNPGQDSKFQKKLSVTEEIKQPSEEKLPRLERTLHDREGNELKVQLISKNEKVTKVQDPSCMANAGDQLRSGNYEFQVQSDSVLRPAQSISLFDKQPLQFNVQQPNMLEVWPGKSGIQSDLLIIHQYASCNLSLVSILKLSNERQELEILPFQTTSGLRDHLEVSTIEQVAYNQIRTTAYHNDSGRTDTTEWKLDERRSEFIPVSNQ